MFIRPYTPSDHDVWDEFVKASRNGTFIQQRRFMDYHSDRFTDASLMLYDDRNILLACLPASIHGTIIKSHGGLTYGGWIMGQSKPSQLQMLEGWNMMICHYKSMGCDTLFYKPSPHIYHMYPSQEDIYALFKSHANIDSILASSVIDLRRPLPFNVNARRHVKRVKMQSVIAEGSERYDVYWTMLTHRLAERYGAKPVHTIDEIKLLHDRFPANIKLWEVRDANDEMLGGVVIFLCNDVAKVQYTASTDKGRAINALDMLFSTLVQYYKQEGVLYLDLGPSNEDNGNILNEGLITQKIGYGARTIAYVGYKIQF